MGELTLKGLDEAAMAMLNRMAQEHGRSIEAEASDILSEHLHTKCHQDDVWERMAESRRKTGRLGISTLELLREDRDSDDPYR